MKGQPELFEDDLRELPSRKAPRRHAKTTREKGRRYPNNKLCPHCYQPFTSKGWKRHESKCNRKENP